MAKKLSEDDIIKIKKLYLSSDHAFTGANKFAKEVKRTHFPNSTLAEITSVVQKFYPYSLFGEGRKRTAAKRYVSNRYMQYEMKLGSTVVSDTLHLPKLGYYVVTFQDLYSKRVYLYSVKRVTAQRVSQLLSQVYEKLGTIDTLLTGRSQYSSLFFHCHVCAFLISIPL